MAELQRRLQDECGVGVTYMEMRFIVLDLGLQLKEEPKETTGKPEDPPAEGAGDPAAPAPAGGVRVSVDALAVPGALVSGKVNFSDGQRALWYLDEMGRLGLDPDVAGYRPNPEDINEFQRQLQALLRKSGY